MLHATRDRVDPPDTEIAAPDGIASKFSGDLTFLCIEGIQHARRSSLAKAKLREPDDLAKGIAAVRVRSSALV